MYTIASNAGVEGALVVGKLLDQDDHDLGYDAAKGMSCSRIPKLNIDDWGIALVVADHMLIEQVNT